MRLDPLLWWGMVIAILMVVFYLIFFAFVLVTVIRDLIHRHDNELNEMLEKEEKRNGDRVA